MPKINNQSHKKNWGAQVAHGVARKADLGNTNTPEDVALAVVQAVVAPWFDVSRGGRWCEPAVGTGNFYLAMLTLVEQQGGDPLAFAQRFDGIDIDAEALDVLRRRLQERFGWSEAVVHALPLICMSLVDFVPPAAYEGVITNPPYLSPKNWASTAEARESMLARWQAAAPGLSARADLFMYFFFWSHRHLAPNGRSVFLCADSWLDAEYGEPLRRTLQGPDVGLEQMMAWPWKPMFRDDTCPVVTVVRRPSCDAPLKPLLLTIDDRHWRHQDDAPHDAVFTGGDRAVAAQEIAAADLADWWSEDHPNRRQRLVTEPSLYRELDAALHRFAATSRVVDAIFQVRTFSWSMQDLLRAGHLTDATSHESSRSYAPVFFQGQARVGKPVDYRQYKRTADFKQSWPLDQTLPNGRDPAAGLVAGGVWFSQAIDRFPLVFAQDPADPMTPWLGVSKYLHMAPREAFQGVPDRLWAAALTSTPALLSMDRIFKEGTRKTLRRDENGYAKEVRKSDLLRVLVPDLTQLTRDQQRTILTLQDRRGQRSLPRLDAAVLDTDWQMIDKIIMDSMGWSDAEQQRWQNLVLVLYWRRMRHLHRYPEALKLFRRSPT